ncbi:MAG: hypothetical protein V4557_14455 [Bacteroidota bacterium]
MVSFPDNIDEQIRPVVEVLTRHGFKTFESCQGGEGHFFNEPTVRFWGTENDLLKAYEICQCYKIAVFEARRVYGKEDVYVNQGIGKENENPIGQAWGIPFNELTFVTHSKTGTIFLPSSV